MKHKKDTMTGYEPLTWDADSKLSAEEKQTWEDQRRDLWRKGIRGEMLERMAVEFAYTITCSRLARSRKPGA